VEDVYYLIRSQQCKTLTSKQLRLELYVYPPDLKKRDLDNLCKAVLDALQRAGIYGDDFYIQQLYLQRMEVKKHGEIKFILRSI
jgi:crossover junction endodeoxyribonuclease RusA